MEVHEKRYAGFWLRFLAMVLDGFIVGIPLMIIQGIVNVIVFVPKLTAYYDTFASTTELDSETMLGFYQLQLEMFWLSFILSMVVYALYYAGMESSKLQGTLGKVICGIKVVDKSEERIKFLRAVGRFFARYLSSLPLLAGYVIAGFRKDKRTLHDIVVQTYVVKK